MKCCFFGHSDIMISEDLKLSIKANVINLILRGYDRFYIGGFGNFDKLCWEIVSELKKSYFQIQRIYCLTDSRHLQLNKRPKILKNFEYENFIYLELSFD